MRRKIVKQGHNTLTITLPAQWCKKNNVVPGDEVNILDDNTSALKIVKDGPIEEKKEVFFKLDSLGRYALAKMIMSYFELGYDLITIDISQNNIKSWSHGEEDVQKAVSFFVSRLLGYEIVMQDNDTIKITNILEKNSEFMSLISKMFVLLEENVRIFSMNAMETKQDLKFHSDTFHDAITRLTSLVLRALNQNKQLSSVELSSYYAIVFIIDKCGDFLRYLYKDIQERNFSHELKKILDSTKEYIHMMHNFFNKYSLEKVNELDNLRGVITKSGLALKTEERDFAAQLHLLVELVQGIIKERIKLELNGSSKVE